MTSLATGAPAPDSSTLEQQEEFLVRTREKCLASSLPWEERGVVLELLGSAKRTFYVVELIRSERVRDPRVIW